MICDLRLTICDLGYENFKMKEEIKNRTKNLAVEIIKFCDELPEDTKYYVISKQIIRSATSVGANYRAACRGKSKADFIAKLGIVEEEADETLYWLELLLELDSGLKKRVSPLYKEMNEILSIVVASKKTARRNL
jgi:four helix bundle protein